MSLYLDTAYVAKCYLNEPDAEQVRALVRGETGLTSSSWSRAELACVLRRHVREGGLDARQARHLHALFAEDVQAGVWSLVPVSDQILTAVERRLAALRRRDVFLRAGDAVHLATAAGAGFREIWSSDRHLLAAARVFGLKGRQV
jgi:predicted nucleic acid-binding protein